MKNYLPIVACAALLCSSLVDGRVTNERPAESQGASSALTKVPPVPAIALEDSRFASFEFNPNQVFDIRVSRDAHVHVLLDAGEEARHFSVNNRMGWDWTPDVESKRSIYVKAKPGAKTTSATLRTTHGIYEMTFIPVDSGFAYRQVRFFHPNVAIEAENNAKLAAERIDGRARDRTALQAEKEDKELPMATAVDRLNFNYAPVGNAPFTPRRVFDDGETTYIVLGDTQDMPALFENGTDGKSKTVAYTYKNNTLIVRRIMKSFTLVLGSSKVEVTASGQAAGFRWPWQKP